MRSGWGGMLIEVEILLQKIHFNLDRTIPSTLIFAFFFYFLGMKDTAIDGWLN